LTVALPLAEQMERKSASQNLKAARKSRKLEEKGLAQTYNNLLAQVKKDLGDADSAEGPGQSKEQIIRNAMINGFLFQMAFLSTMLGDFTVSTTLVALDAYSAVLNYAYLPFLAVTLLMGGGGIWDGFVSTLVRFSLLSAGKTFGFLPFQEALCFPPACGPSGVATEQAEAPQAVEGGGVLNPVFKLQMLMLLTWTQFLGAPAGSIVVNPFTGIWYLLFGLGGTGSALAPGKYMVEISQNGMTLRQPVDVAAR
jgi:hypothetical protein